MDEGREEDWVPDEDYDALNDETFGDEGEEFNWDQARSVLEDFEKTKPNGKGNHVVSPPARGFSHPEIDPAELEDDFDPENALEESISRLVMDDLDDEDEEETMKSKLRRLGGTGASLNTYFMPPQVVNKHLEWFMDKELPGGNSLLGPSVWSMDPSQPASILDPPRTMPVNHQKSPAMRAEQVMKPPPGLSINNFPTGPFPDSNKTRMEGIHGFTNAMGTKPSTQKPVFKTVEEIERELLGEIPGTNASNDTNFNHVETRPPTKQRPVIMTAEELERELLDGAPPAPVHNQMQMQSLPPGARISSPPSRIMPPGSPSSYTQQQQQQQGIMSASPTRPQPPLNMQQMMMQRMAFPPHMVQNPAFAQRLIANVQIPPHHPHPLAANMAAIQQMRMHHMQQFRAGGGRMPPVMMPQGGFPMMPQRPGFPGISLQNQGGQEQFLRKLQQRGDPYCGLMNEKDKQRLRNIQIVQLQNDHPYTTDYYSLMFIARRLGNDPRRQRECLVKLFPRKSDENSNRRDYQPAHFENSLGKLQAVSALAPKKAIDTVIRVVDAGPTNRSGMKAYRYILLEIERLYECLLKIQEADIRSTHLMNADESMMEVRNECVKKVKVTLQNPQKLSEILSFHKGKMLVSRLMPLMDAAFKFSLLSYIVRHFEDWTISKNNEVDVTYPYLRHCILSADLPNIAYVFNSTVPVTAYESMLTTKLGISMILSVFHHAESILQGISSSKDDKTEHDLSLFYKELRVLVTTVVSNVKKLAKVTDVPTNAIKHLERWGLNVEQITQFHSALNGRNNLPVIH